ncbi:MAG: hypothetical protein FH748_08200 [Balneolaceae bacterium]|nr:hypothetical protein [Balneolaceae bacterium]
MKIWKSNFWILLCSVLVLLNIYSLYQKNEIAEGFNEELNTLKTAYESNFQSLLNRMRIQFDNEGIVIDKETELVPDYDEGKKIKLKELVQNKWMLVLNFSEITCKSCVESEIEKIKEISNEIGSENVLILSSYERNSDLLIFKRLNKLNLPIYNRKGENLGLQIDYSNANVFLLNSASYKTELFFIADKEAPKLSEKYYSTVKRYFE